MKNILDHFKKKPSKAQIEKAQAEAVRIQEGMNKLNTLLDEYGLALTVQQSVIVTKRQ